MKCAFIIAVVLLLSGGAFVMRAGSSESLMLNAGSAAALYAKNCASCHGRDGRARTLKARRNHARNLSDSEWQNRVSDERIFNSIMNGKGKMPAYGRKFSEQEIDALVPYVRAFKK